MKPKSDPKPTVEPATVLSVETVPLVPPPDRTLSGSLSATTTEQEDLTTHGQRRINMIWELTQAAIALMVIGSNMFAALWNVMNGTNVDVPLILSSALFLVLGNYFARTNHQNIGGTGSKANEKQEYKGR